MSAELYLKINLKKLSLLVSFLCFGSVLAALVTQHMFDMQPCAWCVLQRILFIAIGVVSIFCYFFANKKITSIALWAFMSFLDGLGILVATYQFFVASKSFDCKISLAEKIINNSGLDVMLPEVFGIFALCGDANPLVLGIPYTVCSLILFFIISNISAIGLIKSLKSIELS